MKTSSIKKLYPAGQQKASFQASSKGRFTNTLTWSEEYFFRKGSASTGQQQ
jgi:hypothetical protein